MRKFYLSILGAGMLVTAIAAIPAGATARSSGTTLGSTGAIAAPTTTMPLLPHGEAYFGDKVIDLAQGWSGVQSCLIPSNGSEQCFSSQAAAKAAAGVISAQEQAVNAAAQSSVGAQRRTVANARAIAKAKAKGHVRGGRDDGPCLGDNTEWLWLYQNSNFGGYSVGIQGTDVRVDLRSSAFQNQTSSYINDTGCEVFMVQNYDLSGPWLSVGVWTYSTYIGNAWNDKVVAVYIAS